MSEAELIDKPTEQPDKKGSEGKDLAEKPVTAADVEAMTPSEQHAYVETLPDDQQVRVMSGLDAIPPKDKDEEPSKEDSGKSAPKEGEDGKPVEEPSKEDSGEPAKEKVPEFTGIKIGEQVFPNEEAVHAAYLEGQQMIGRQAGEIGDLRKQVPKEAPIDDPEPEFDPDDQEKSKLWTEWSHRDAGRKVKATDVEDKQTADAQADLAAAEKFISEHGEISLKDMVAINNLRLEKGLSYDAALAEFQNKNSPGSEHDPTKKSDVIKKQEEAEKVLDTLDKGGGSAGAEVDISTMSPDVFHEYLGTLSEAQKERVMMGGEA